MRPILVVVPSLRRPHNAARFIDAWASTTSGFSDLLFVLEDNDPTIPQYPTVPVASALVGEYRSLGNAFNAAFEAHPDYVAYAPLNDDHLIRTEGWEPIVLAALQEHRIVYGDDGFQGARLATAPVLRGDLVRDLGYIAPPGIPHLYIDNAWMEIGERLGSIRYLPEVLFEHMHPEAGKGTWDPTYRAANSAEAYGRDGAAFAEWLRDRAPGDIERAR